MAAIGLASLVAILLFSPSVLAAGIDSRAYTCSELEALVARQGYVFIGNPEFQDFVVANGSYCNGDQVARPRSVPTSDNPECPVNYCEYVSGGFSGD